MRKNLKRGQSRHYSDIGNLVQQGTAAKALRDLTLFRQVVEHRKVFFEYKWVDYSSLRPGTLRLIPAEGRMSEWRDDYNRMKEMFFGSPPSFDEIIAVVREFETSFNSQG